MNEEGLSCEAPMPEMENRIDERLGEYVPSAGEILRSNEVCIEVLDCGAVVRVGCKKIAFSTVEEALKEINLYFKDTVFSYKKWNQRFIKR
jgi:hypothetical protein